MFAVESRLRRQNATEFSRIDAHGPGDADDWVVPFIDAMLGGILSTADFEHVVDGFVTSGSIKLSAPAAAAETLRYMEEARRIDGRYGVDRPELNFRSLWLVGEHGRPGAIYIDAPAERLPAPRSPVELNRPLHLHDSGRMALILHGSATFIMGEPGNRDTCALARIPVSTGDLLFWPAWTAHSFDAQDGFGLLSGMAAYVSPEEDGFSLPIDAEDRSR